MGHKLTVIASDVDPATERIVTYLNTGFAVPSTWFFFVTSATTGGSTWHGPGCWMRHPSLPCAVPNPVCRADLLVYARRRL